MKVCIYLEMEEKLAKCGIGKAVENQKRALELAGVEYTTNAREDFDIIHINTIGPRSLYLAKKMKFKGKKVIMHSHSLAEDFRNSFWFSNAVAPALKQYLKRFYNQADMVLCPTRYAMHLLREYGVTREVRIISNGVDLNRFKNVDLRREEAKRRFSLDGTVPFSVGHVFARKGVRTFVRVAEHFPNTFVWFGSIYPPPLGPREMVNLVNNAPKNVKFPGFVENVLAYSAGDIFFFPSKCELQGIVVLEAAASKKPILVRDIPVYDGWLTHDENCLKAKNKDEFIVHLKELMEDKRVRRKLSAKAYRMVQEHSLENIGCSLKDIYESLLKR